MKNKKEFCSLTRSTVSLRRLRHPCFSSCPADGKEAFQLLKNDFDSRTEKLKKHADSAGKKLSNMFNFSEDVFGDGQEMVILVTELTISYYGSRFISRYGCKEYFAHNKELLFYKKT